MQDEDDVRPIVKHVWADFSKLASKIQWLALISAAVLSVLVAFSTMYLQLRTRPEKPLEAQLAATLTALQDNSRQAVKLLEDLQREVASRTRTAQQIEGRLRELRQQRTLLELTDEQKRAIAALVRSKPSAREILTSLDFWLGRVLVSLFFLGLGIGFTVVLRRSSKRRLPAP